MRRYNFDAVSCESCKAFFRRNAFNVCFALLVPVLSICARASVQLA